ncbi:MAG: CdaR family protein, partial [Candidatus Limnocylindrales bacterium]
SASTLPVSIQPTIVGQPDNTFSVITIPPVDEVRFLSPSGVPAISTTFTASVDVSNVTPGSGPVSLPVIVRSIDERINVVGFSPDRVTIQLDKLESREVPVTVDPGAIPDGLDIGDPTVDPTTVIVSGPASVINTVVAARVAPVIQASGLTVNQDLPLTAIDRLGNPVNPVKVEPDTARVKIPVFPDARSRSVPVSATVTGTPAAGFEVATVIVDPQVVTVEGGAERLAALESIETEPISVSGASKTVAETVELAIPDDIAPVGASTVKVTVTFRPVTGTRSFDVGLRYVGEEAGLRYSVPLDRVRITIGGSVADLDRLDGATLVVDLEVGGLEPGTTNVPVAIDLPVGLSLVSSDPSTVPVTVTAPPPSAAPSASPTTAPASPSASPGG